MHMPPPVHGASIVGQQIHDSELINNSFECAFVNLSASNKVEAIGHFSLRKIVAMLQLFRQIRHELREERPKLVYITPSTWDWGFYRDYMMTRMIKHYGVHVVAHFHNKPPIAFTHKWYNKSLYRKFFRGIDAIFLADKLADTFREYLPAESIHICPNGMPKTIVVSAPISTTPPYTFLFVSNMMAEKGVLVLLEACKILKEKELEFGCSFVGQWSDISEKQFNEYCAEWHLSGHVQALGPKYGEDKEHLLRTADAFVFPTYYHGECLSLVVLEAMQHALPIITTAEGALAEVVDNQNSGFIVERQNAKALAEKMQYLIEHPDMGREMGRRGRAKYEREYTSEIFENRLCSILTECVQRN